MWLTFDADRILYVDRGKDVILCDRLPVAGTLIVRLTPDQVEAIASAIRSRSQE